jgi:hypothetical protein
VTREQPVPSVRHEADDLRARSGRLREKSRDLQQRSQASRDFVPGAALRREVASARDAGDREAEFARLRHAETELETAIAQCRFALEEVRQALRWQDIGPAAVVH